MTTRADLTDLTRPLPTPWHWSGASPPVSDGVQLYRTLAQPNTLSFSTAKAQLMVFHAAALPKDQTLKLKILVNHEPVDEISYPAGQFTGRTVGFFSRPGQNEMQLLFDCQPVACQSHTPPLYQLTLSAYPAERTNAPVGLNAEDWPLDSQGSALLVTGLSSVQVGGSGVSREVRGHDVRIEWKDHAVTPAQLSFLFWSSAAFRLEATAGGQRLYTATGPANSGVKADIGLIGRDVGSAIDLKVTCLGGQPFCASLMNTHLTVVRPSGTGLAGAVVGVVLAVCLLAVWLRVWRPTT